MKKFVNNQHGFTLVELMIVIVIVGILAAVAIPIYQGNVKKAKMSECDAAMGTIRTSLRVFFAEHGRYPIFTGAVTGLGDSINIAPVDLSGKFFATTDYSLESDDSTYTITCEKDDIFGVDNDRTLDQAGTFSGGL
jgi:prepilin-type N-terminal cleavage/methylation domain-containing protein